MEAMKAKQVQTIAWGLSAAVTAIAFYRWGSLYSWKIVTAYQLFPLFGLLAFSLMWSHYIASVIRQISGLEKGVLKKYFEITAIAVLVFILLHPGILIWQLWKDKFGLPPGSVYKFVGPSLKVAVILGVISWVAFIAYEFHRKYGDHSWWKFVQMASDAAMILILIHALQLGSHLQEGWFKYLWYFYGVTLAGALIYTYWRKYQTRVVK